MKSRVARGLAISFFFLALVGSAPATTVTTTSFSAWQSDLTGSPTLVDFSGLQNGASYSTSAGFSANPGPFVFTGPDGGSYNLHAYGTTPYLQGPSDGTGYINVAMPSGGENAIFVKLATTGATQLTLTLSDGEILTPAAGMFGLSISHDITWLQVSTTNGSSPEFYWAYYGASNLTQDGGGQTQQPAAEVATIFLLGGGLLILFGSQKKVRRILFA